MRFLDDRITAVESCLMHAVTLEGAAPRLMTLAERMAYYRVPGVSIAVINKGEIDWAKGYGAKCSGKPDAVTTGTLFQAASISKVIAAVGTLKLVDTGKLDLDRDVNSYLKRWKVPVDAFTTSQPVTLRGILSHTAGLSVHGFEGYEQGTPLPSVVDILDGQNNTNSAPVRVTCVPGTEYSYSGGGYTILQLLLEDLLGKPFSAILGELVLSPLGMISSFYEQPLPVKRSPRAACGHQQDGSALPNEWHVYPELAAAGLWTTPVDLAGFLIAMQKCQQEVTGAFLSPAITAQMLTRGIGRHGLGFSISPEQPGWYGHGGSNEGFRSKMASLQDEPEGVVVMTNGEFGYDLAEEVIRSAALVYGWQVLQPVVQRVVEVDSSEFDLLVGTYTVTGSPENVVIISKEGRNLYINQPRVTIQPLKLHALSQHSFLIEENGMIASFSIKDTSIQLEVSSGDASFKSEKPIP